MVALEQHTDHVSTPGLGDDIWADCACMDFLRHGTEPVDASQAKRVRRRAKWFRWFQGTLHRFVFVKDAGQYSLRVVPPPSVRDEIIVSLHAELGHVGEKRTIDALTQLYWWYGMTVDAKRVLSTCKLCKRVGVSPPHEVQEMQTDSHDEYGMFYRWGLDYLGEIQTSANGNCYVLIAIDYFSKWVEAFPVPKADSATTTRLVLTQLVARFGVPAEIVCDNGPSFKGVFEAFCKDRLIDLRFITPGMPRSNGLAENAVKTIKRSLQKYAAAAHGADHWDTEGLANILLGYRCTRQAATGLSPAQILYAQDPAVRADKWVSRRHSMSFVDIEASADELVMRAQLAKELRLQVAENLRLAHARNAARFKALRSGLYQPKINHFQPGDFVFVLTPGEQVPGGALGIPVRDEILSVIEVRPSGVLLLENQGGRRFTRHMEQCVPCCLSNVEGTVHRELIKPSWKFPCSVCKDHRQEAKMLLCDGCNLGFHTFCLPLPLDDVPDGIWLCHHCTTAGVTPEQVGERRARYIPVEQSRPRIELPGISRRRHARTLADKWHGAAVRHRKGQTDRCGRVTFTDVKEPKWFKIYWQDGRASLHDTRILPRLEVIPEQEAPNDLLPRPDPVVIMTTLNACAPWSVQSESDIMQRLTTRMPGDHAVGDVALIHQSLRASVRKAMTVQHPPRLLECLNDAVDFSSCEVILDPWAANKAVEKGLDTQGRTLCLNDKSCRKGVHLSLEPLEAVLYERVIKAFGRLDAVVMCPPPPLADMAFINALDFADRVVCMLVPDTWLLSAHVARQSLLSQLERDARLFIIRDVDPAVSFCWVCVFDSPHHRDSMVVHHMQPAHSIILVQRIPGRCY